jgi:hypothetical protein
MKVIQVTHIFLQSCVLAVVFKKALRYITDSSSRGTNTIVPDSSSPGSKPAKAKSPSTTLDVANTEKHNTMSTIKRLFRKEVCDLFVSVAIASILAIITGAMDLPKYFINVDVDSKNVTATALDDLLPRTRLENDYNKHDFSLPLLLNAFMSKTLCMYRIS